MKTKDPLRFKWLIRAVLLLTALNINIYGMGSKDSREVYEIFDVSIRDMLRVEVVTASKKEEKSSDAPGIIEVITEQEIKAFGAVSLMDILERAASIQPNLSFIFVQNLVSLRGDLQQLTDRHVLLLINGRPIRETKSGGINSPVYTAFPIDIIERIEIVRGPGSVLYGTNAFAGVINIITKQNFEKSNLMLSLGGGSFGAFESSLAAGINSGPFKGVVGARFFSEEGWNYKALTTIPVLPYPDTTAELNFGEKKLGIFTQLGYKGWQLTGFYTNYDEDALGLYPFPQGKIGNYGSSWFFDLGFHGKLAEMWETNLNLTLNSLRFTTRDLETREHLSEPYSWGYLGEASVSGRLSDSLHIIIGGVFDVRKNIGSEIGLVREDYSQTHLAAYTQVDYKLSDNLKVIAGAQLNKPHRGDADVVPRLGFIYTFPKGFGIKALYGHAFRSPWPNEQLLDITVLKGNPDLGPEKIATLDLQVSYQSEKARFSLTYFHSKTKDLIATVPTDVLGTSRFSNVPGFKAEGVEFEMKASLFEDFFLTGSALVMDNQDPQYYTPSSMFKLGASYRTHFGLDMGLFLTHFGTPPKNQGKELNPPAEAVNLLSLKIGFKLPWKLPLEIVLYARNLLDTDYYFPEYVYGWTNTLPVAPGRAIYSKIILRL